MANLCTSELVDANGARLERVHFFQRQLLTADDMVTEQEYFREKLRRHNRYLHGWGVVCGLQVHRDERQNAPPWGVRIDPGYALGPCGDEIYVPEPMYLDLASCGPGAATDPCEPSMMRHATESSGRQTIYLAIKYAECVARPVRVMPAGCACEEEACAYSRIRDSYQVECLSALPASHGQEIPSLCELDKAGMSPPCPPCPDEPWVVLAMVTLPDSATVALADGGINMSIRRHIFSTAILQQQLIECCCEEQPQPTECADLEITKSCLVVPGHPDGIVTYVVYYLVFTVTIANHGDLAAEHVVIEDTIDIELQPNLTIPADAFQFGGDDWTETGTRPLKAELQRLGPHEARDLRISISMEVIERYGVSKLTNTAKIASTSTPNGGTYAQSDTAVWPPA